MSDVIAARTTTNSDFLVLESQLLSILHFLLRNTAKLFQDLKQALCGGVVTRKAICEWMFEESITLPEGPQLCVFSSKCGIWVRQGLYICMCVFSSVCGFSRSGNLVSYLRLLISNYPSASVTVKVWVTKSNQRALRLLWLSFLCYCVWGCDS